MVPCYSTPNTATYDALALCSLGRLIKSFFAFFFLNTLNMDFLKKNTFFGVFPFPIVTFPQACAERSILYILTMSSDALTTAGRHLLSFDFEANTDHIKDFEWSAFSFFFCVFYQKASGRRGPPPFFPRKDNACIRAKSARTLASATAMLRKQEAD